MRTALSPISFGFGIAKFFEYVREKKGEGATWLGPRDVGILMIAIGIGALILAEAQHRRAIKALRSRCPDLPRSLAGAMGAAIGLLGALALAGAIVR